MWKTLSPSFCLVLGCPSKLTHDHPNMAEETTQNSLWPHSWCMLQVEVSSVHRTLWVQSLLWLCSEKQAERGEQHLTKTCLDQLLKATALPRTLGMVLRFPEVCGQKSPLETPSIPRMFLAYQTQESLHSFICRQLSASFSVYYIVGLTWACLYLMEHLTDEYCPS